MTIRKEFVDLWTFKLLFSWKMRKRASILSWRLLERILHKIAGITLHPSTQGFFFILMIHRLCAKLYFWVVDRTIWKNWLFLNYTIEFCHGKTTFFGCFLAFQGQKVTFFELKRYENLWYSENRTSIQTYAKGISLKYSNGKTSEFYQTAVRPV